MNRKQFLYTSLLSCLAVICKACGLENKKGSVAIRPALSSNGTDTLISSQVKYFKKGDAEFDILRKGFNKRIDKYPQLIAFCQTAADVSEAIKYAIKNKLPVAVKSGGHSFEGFSCNNYGLVADCSQMKNITWMDNQTVSVGPGWLIRDLQNELFSKNKILPTGTCGGVGIGGLTLGGGYGIFSREFGLTCDNLKGVTLVDGAGEIRTVKNESEILWGCRGGGNAGLGVVTEMTFKVHDLPASIQCTRFTTRNISLTRSKYILKEWFTETADLPAGCFSAFVFNGRSIYILLTNTRISEPAATKVIEKFSGLTDRTNHGKPIPVLQAARQFYGLKNPVYFKNASAGMYNGFPDVENFIEALLQKIIDHPGLIYQVNTLGANITNEDFEKASCFPHRSKKWLSELQSYWQTGSQTMSKLQLFKETKNLCTISQDSQYSNYPDINEEDWKSKYYGKNYSRLLKLKQLLDPENIFRGEQTIS